MGRLGCIHGVQGNTSRVTVQILTITAALQCHGKVIVLHSHSNPSIHYFCESVHLRNIRVHMHCVFIYIVFKYSVSSTLEIVCTELLMKYYYHVL